MVQIIEGSDKSPEIIVDAGNSFIAFRGVCFPEAAARLFDPVLSLVKEITDYKKAIHMTFELKYFNSVSSVYLLKLFVQVATALRGENTYIEWRFDPEDEDNRKKGEFFAELSGLHFQFVPSRA